MKPCKFQYIHNNNYSQKLRATGHGLLCNPYCLATESPRGFRYLPTHFAPKKQSPGLFFLTAWTSLRFKPCHQNKIKKQGFHWNPCFLGRGWGIRTPANGVRVRCATVTLILYVTSTKLIILKGGEKSRTFFQFAGKITRARLAYPGFFAIIHSSQGKGFPASTFFRR